jgi:uncharacterized protein (TIGR02996 family)
MTELDAILEDIRADPADDLPRLALADWLMEQDDAASRSRGEFIHARCRAASLPPRDPERAALQLRAEALREEHEIVWLGGLAEHLASWDFERGMIVAGFSSQALSRRAFARMFASPGWKWVIGLRGSALSSRELTAFFERPQLASVTSIDLRDCNLDRTGILALGTSRHLSHLASLDLGYTRLGNEGVRDLLEEPRLPSLRILLLDCNGIGADGVQALAASQDLPRLARLDLSRNRIEDRGASTLARYSRYDDLCELRLASCGIGKRGGTTLASSSALANLTLLDLSDNPLDAATRAELRERFGSRVVLG